MKFASFCAGLWAAILALLLGTAPNGLAQLVVNMVPETSSNESNQDSEPNLAVNPTNPLQMAGSAFTPNPPLVPPGTSPIYLSADGGLTWTLSSIVPGSNHDITLRFGGTSNTLYVSWIDLRGVFAHTNILRVTPFPTPSSLTVLQSISRPCFFFFCKVIDQPYVEATTVLAGPSTGNERVYIGENDLAKAGSNGGNGDTASLNQSLDAATAAPPGGFNLPSQYVDARQPCNQDAPSVRSAMHSSGVVYVAFIHDSQCPSPLTADIMVARDDSWGAGATPYSDLTGADGKPGMAVATGVAETFTRVCEPEHFEK